MKASSRPNPIFVSSGTNVLNRRTEDPRSNFSDNPSPASEVYRPEDSSYFPSMSKRVSKEPEVIVRDGKPVSVILPIKEYEELLERSRRCG